MHINVCRVSCGGVFNMLLVLSITFYLHYNIWGCMCSTGPFQYRWLKGYIYRSCYYHHQIGSIHLSHCYHVFPWLCAWDDCYIIFCHKLHIRSAKTGNLFLCKLIWRHRTKTPVKYILSIVWARLSIFSPLSIMQYVGLYFSVYPFPLWWLREYICFDLLSSSNRKYELWPIV